MKSSSPWSKYEQFMEQADSFILDQIRLLSLESLYRKTVEYHYNCHSFFPSSLQQQLDPPSSTSPSNAHDKYVIEISYFNDKTYHLLFLFSFSVIS
jgi:hypothetical protein